MKVIDLAVFLAKFLRFYTHLHSYTLCFPNQLQNSLPKKKIYCVRSAYMMTGGLHPSLYSNKNGTSIRIKHRDGFRPIQEPTPPNPRNPHRAYFPPENERCCLGLLSLHISASSLSPVHPAPLQVLVTPATSFIFLIFGFRPPEVVTLASFLWRNDNLRRYHLPHLPELPPILEFLLPERNNSWG